jgi:hypothetical protein
VTVARTDWRDLPPVAEEEQIEIPEIPSQTFLKHHDRCDRAAYLYQRYKAGAGSHELNRGAVQHDVMAALTKEHIIGQGESTVPPELGKRRLYEYLDEHPELQVSAVERDAMRYMIANWCLGSWFDPDRILAVETTLTLEIGGFTIIGRVDLAEDLGIDMVQVTDYKTSFDMPDSDEFKAQAYTPEGDPRFAGNYQTQIYALLMAEGKLDDGLPLPGNYERFRQRLVFPRYLRPEGLAYREVVVSRKQLGDFRVDIEHQLRRLREVNGAKRKWQPTPGTHCRECPAEYACPLPKLLRAESQLADLDSIEDLERAGASWSFMSKRAANLKARIKKAAIRLGNEDPSVLDLGGGDRGVYIGRDQGLVFIPTDSEEIKDKERFRLAVEGAVEYGHPFDWEDHVNYRQGTKFDKRNLPPRRNGRSNGNG